MRNSVSIAEARARVHILYTGGTVGMRPTPGGLVNVGAEELVEALHEFGAEEGIYWELELLHDDDGQVVPPIDSSAVTPRHWLWMARAVERRYAEFDGFVILHGTDTLAYTASALSFLMENLSKPVVLTGAQLPIFALRSDARQNILNALLIAGNRASGLPLVPEVTVCFGDQLLRGNRCRKASTSGWQGFTSPNYPPLGILGESIRIRQELLRPLPEAGEVFSVHSRLVEDVLDLTLFPGIRPAQVEALLKRPELEGVVLRAYGSGNAPSDPDLLAALRRATRSQKTILIVTQCQEGKVDLGRYASSHVLLESGVASGFDLTPEAALTKLMWVLALYDGPDVREQLQLNQRGEQGLNQYELELQEGETPFDLRGPVLIQRSHLERAVLRLSGLRVAQDVVLDVVCEGQIVAQLQASAGKQDLVTKVTAAVRPLMHQERSVHFRLQAPAGTSLTVKSAHLVLVTHA